MAKIQAKAKQDPEAELSVHIIKKRVCLYQWDYIINCNESKNDNDKVDHINKTNIDQDVDIKANIKNIACFEKAMSLCNKQHLSYIWGSIY